MYRIQSPVILSKISSVCQNHGRGLQENTYFIVFIMFDNPKLAVEHSKDNPEASMETVDGFKSAGGGEDS